MTWLEIGLIAICVVLVVLPPKYDPAVQLREWLNEKEGGEDD